MTRAGVLFLLAATAVAAVVAAVVASRQLDGTLSELEDSGHLGLTR